MAELYQQCAICGRKQATGLLSAGAWGQVPLPTGVRLEHPAVRDASVRACPTCIGRDGDWAATALAALGLEH
jgi:hypothetical protein